MIYFIKKIKKNFIKKTRNNLIMKKLLILFLIINSLSQWETIDKYNYKINKISPSEIDQFLTEHENRAVMELFSSVPSKFVEKTLKLFKEYFIVFQTEKKLHDQIEGIQIYPPGSILQKKENAMIFHAEGTNAKDIAQKLNSVIENKIHSIEKISEFQNTLSTCIQILKKIPVILFDNKKIKNNYLGYKSLPFIKEFSDYFQFYYLNDDPKPFMEQFKLKKLPTLVSFIKTKNEQGEEQIGGAPFTGSLNFKNMAQYLLQIIQHENKDNKDFHNKQNEVKDVKIEDRDINEFTNYDKIEKKCKEKICLLAFEKKMDTKEEKILEHIDILKKVQGFYNKESVEIFIIDGGCYYNKLLELNLDWDMLPWLVYYDGKTGSIYNHQERYNLKGIRKSLIKIKKNILKPIKKNFDNLIFRERDCEMENLNLRIKFAQFKKNNSEFENDEILKEVLEESKKNNDGEEIDVKETKQERRKRKREERKKRREREKLEKEMNEMKDKPATTEL